MKKIGFIGGGNMATAIIGGIISSKCAEASDVFVYDKNPEASEKLCLNFGINNALSSADVCGCDILFLAVKPNVVYSVIDEIKDKIQKDTVVVSIVAGQSIEKITQAFGQEIKIVRVMPNTPALVGEGMSAVSFNSLIDDADRETVLSILKSFGKAEVVSENLMDAVTGVSGSSPAYIFMLIEAMADAAVLGGIPRKQAYTFAAQSVLGSAKMVLELAQHPAELKDMVCSPGGTTIEAVKVLEDKGFRSAVIDAIDACIKKSQSM